MSKETERTNHTDMPKTHAIECQGYKDSKTGKTLYADAHVAVRLVHKQDVHQCTRCEACQDEFTKIRSKQRRAETAGRRRAQKLVAEAENAQATKEQLKDKLTKEQVAELDKAIKMGEEASKMLA